MKNLLSNAVKFTPENGEIRVSSRVSRESVIIVVADTGIGIAEADIPRVVIPFEQIEQADGHPQQGTGFGLAVPKSLVEMQGGTIRVESTEGVPAHGCSSPFQLHAPSSNLPPESCSSML